MALKVEWTERAYLHIEEVLNYWEDKNGSRNYSIKLYDWIQSSLELLATYPESGRRTENQRLRKKIVKDSCTGSSQAENKPRKRKKFNLFNQVKRDDHNMHLKSNVQLFCDFQTFHLSSTIALPDLPNQPFWPHP